MRPLTTAVTALSFISFPSHPPTPYTRNVLFAGIGNQVHIYSNDNLETPVIRQPVFVPSLTIHGFSSSSVTENRHSFVSIHAGRTVSILQLEFDSSQQYKIISVKVCTTKTFTDWIWHSKWINNSILIVAAGHSNTFLCQFNNALSSLSITNIAITNEEYSELTWCATLFIVNQYLYSICGTSFGHILFHSITSVASLLSSSSTSATIMTKTHVLNDGHAGPVMKITLSNDNQRMITASVDRSIRIWRPISDSDSICNVCPTYGCFVPFVTHFGHLARVWDVAFLNMNSIVSVGEDRSCRIWSGTESSKQISLYRSHSGRNVWSVAVSYNEDEQNGNGSEKKIKNEQKVILTTGGEDGCIKSQHINLKQLLNNNNYNNDGDYNVSFKLPHNLKNPRKVGGANNESARSVTFISNNQLIITTDFGRILAVNLNNQETWTEIARDCKGTAFTPYSLSILTSNKMSIICAGQTNGDVTVIPTLMNDDGNDLWKGKVSSFCALTKEGSRMVMGIFGINNNDCEQSSLNTNELGHIFVACPTGDLYHWRLSSSESSIANHDININYEMVAIYESHRQSKTTLITSICLLRERNILITGDKGGRIHLFNIPKNSKSDKSIQSYSWLRVHNDRVSHLSHLSSNKILSSGFDGLLTNLIVGKNTIIIESRERIAERADTIISIFNNNNYHNNNNNKMMKVIAFRGSILSIWDIEKRTELFRYDVGNWRRAHTINFLNNNQVNLAFWRGGKMYVVNQYIDDNLMCGGVEFHGSRANDIDWCDENEQLVVTGGEDTIVRVSKIEWDLNELKWKQRLQGHISCVGGVVANVKKNLIASCGGGDEVVVWCRAFDDDDDDDKENDGVWKLAMKVRIGMLLGEDHDEIVEENDDDNEDDDDDDEGEGVDGRRSAIMRVTGIDCLKEDGEQCKLCEQISDSECSCVTWVVGRSDGSVVKLHCTKDNTHEKKKQATWNMNAEVLGKHNDGAVLSVNCSSSNTQKNGHRSFIVSGGSGGTIHLWNNNRFWNGAHKGGVNCIAVGRLNTPKNDDIIVVVSGGDDETVRVQIDYNISSEMVWQSEIGEGHHAAVTGISVIENKEFIVVVSVGADQQVCFWKVALNFQLNLVCVKCVRKMKCNVPDVASVCVTIRERDGCDFVVAVVCGYGLEVIDGPTIDMFGELWE